MSRIIEFNLKHVVLRVIFAFIVVFFKLIVLEFSVTRDSIFNFKNNKPEKHFILKFKN